MRKPLITILRLLDTRIEILERSNPSGVTEKFLRKDYKDLVKALEDMCK